MRSTPITVFFTLLAVALMWSGNARAFDEGIDYRTLNQPQPTEAGDKVEVLEIFWYGCPHCFHLEPSIHEWMKTKPDYVSFRRMPAVLGGSWANHARTYYALEMIGQLEETHERFFSALHDQKKRLYSPDQIADWMGKNGVDKAEFLKAFHSFVVDMKVRRAKQMGQRLGIDGVPGFVVNGKYYTSPSMTAGREKAIAVIDYLAAREVGVAPTVASDEAPAGQATEQVQEAVGEAAASQ